MAVETAAPQDEELDEFIEAYESVRAKASRIDLAQFLPPRDHSLYRLVLRELVRVDLEYGWRRGEPLPLNEYQSRFPELFDNAESLEAVAFEEYRLRRQLGDNPAASGYREQWGVAVNHWPGAAENDSSDGAIGAQHGAFRAPASLRSLQAEATLPPVGTQFLDFELLSELGQGSFGRVYLAKQKGLAGRRVVLKISANYTVEVDNLAQVQHTNIIPIHSIHRADALQAICMPYLGSVTLADVLNSLRGRQTLPQSGKAFADTAQACKSTIRPDRGPADFIGPVHQAEVRATLPAAPPVAWKQMEALSYVQAVLWMFSRLADGLAHAHERGILHRDLKPANILLTDDGQPMLLDFNLSEDIKILPGDSTAAVGGTLPYMAPEHLRAFQHSESRVDPRSDIYSLGVILHELLTGKQPFPLRTGPVNRILPEMIEDRRNLPRFRAYNRAVSPAVESIVRYCLAPNPDLRYQSARQLQEDLERQLAHRPLQHAPDRSLSERIRKLVRRHPRFARAAIAVTGVVIIVGLASLLGLRHIQLAQWEAISLSHQHRDDLQKARFTLVTSYSPNSEEAKEGISAAHKSLDRLGVRDNTSWWNATWIQRLPSGEQRQLREDTSELLGTLAAFTRARAESGDAGQRVDGIRSALELNRLAESCCRDDIVPLMLRRQRDTLHRLLDPRAKTQETIPEMTPSSAPTAKDSCMLAQDLMEERRFHEAGVLWRQATRQDPKVLWGWAGLGAYYENLEKHEQAAACYSTCVALMPGFPLVYFKRGTAYLNTKSFAEALADFDRFLADRPDAAEGYINRALALQGLNRHQSAIDDLSKAIDLGTTQTRVYLLRGQSYAHLGNIGAAQRDRAKGLELEPTDDVSWVVRGMEYYNNDQPKEALADFDRALRLNPRSRDGLQDKAAVLSEKLGRTKEAVEVLNKEIELYPEFVPARAGRGVLLARLGKRDEAIRDAEECVRRDVEPLTLYQVANIYALTSRKQPDDRQRAILLLNWALDKGFGSDYIGTDTDLDPIRGDADFQRLLAKVQRS
jgi:serine/threonine protein kinase/Tfp pilus assembly protein PilF